MVRLDGHVANLPLPRLTPDFLLQMAPTNQNGFTTSHQSLSDAFFQSVDPTGYPAMQQKEQPWMKYPRPATLQTDKRRPLDGNSMMVICSLRHDYGSSPEAEREKAIVHTNINAGSSTLGGY